MAVGSGGTGERGSYGNNGSMGAVGGGSRGTGELGSAEKTNGEDVARGGDAGIERGVAVSGSGSSEDSDSGDVGGRDESGIEVPLTELTRRSASGSGGASFGSHAAGGHIAQGEPPNLPLTVGPHEPVAAAPIAGAPPPTLPGGAPVGSSPAAVLHPISEAAEEQPPEETPMPDERLRSEPPMPDGRLPSEPPAAPEGQPETREEAEQLVGPHLRSPAGSQPPVSPAGHQAADDTQALSPPPASAVQHVVPAVHVQPSPADHQAADGTLALLPPPASAVQPVVPAVHVQPSPAGHQTPDDTLALPLPPAPAVPHVLHAVHVQPSPAADFPHPARVHYIGTGACDALLRWLVRHFVSRSVPNATQVSHGSATGRCLDRRVKSRASE